MFRRVRWGTGGGGHLEPATQSSPEGHVADSECSMTLTEIYTCLQELYSSTEHNNLQSTISRLKPLDFNTRKKVVNTLIGDRTLLFLASMKGYVAFVNYYLDECGADIEQKGLFEVQEDHTKHLVTPLWAAAVSNQLGIVRALVDHGADINGVSDTESTPVRSACYMTNVDVVKFLVERRADIHKPNVHGGTCLINSIQSVDLCKFLLDHGANVNDRDQSGNIALHYAIREGRIESTKLLVEYGSDVHLTNDLGDDALQTACLRGFEEIVEYLIEKTKPSKKRIVDSYEVMGANFIDEKHDINQGLAYWRLALGLRLSPPLLPKTCGEAHEYFVGGEVRTFAELSEISDDSDLIYMQSLMVRERVLGPTHKDTAFGLMYRGAVYADTRRYQKCIDIWTYALRVRHQYCEPLSHETVLINLHSLTKLFWELWTDSSEPHRLKFGDVLKVVDILVAELENRNPDLDNKRVNTQRDYSQITMLLGLHLTNLMTKMSLVDDEKLVLRRLVHRFISTKIISKDGMSLLHLVLDWKSADVDGERCSVLANDVLVQLLVECGADTNICDNDGSVPLHALALSMQNDRANAPAYERLARYLLANGAHFDTRNTAGLVAWRRLQVAGCRLEPVRYVTLRCLAAQCIVDNRLAFQGEIPTSLEPFVKLH